MREKRKAAIEGEQKSKRIALDLAAAQPPSPHTIPSSLHTRTQTPSPTPGDQLERELYESSLFGSGSGLGVGAGSVLKTPNKQQGNGGNNGQGGGPRVGHSRMSSISGAGAGGSWSRPTLAQQVMQMNKQQREMTGQRQGKPPTPSKIIKLSISGEKMLQISSSPPRPVDSMGDVIMGGTPASVRAPQHLNSSPQNHRRARSRTLLHSSSPTASGYQLPPHRRLQSSPTEPQFPPSQGRLQSSPVSAGGYREPGQLHSSPPEVKISRARAQSRSGPVPIGSQQMTRPQGQGRSTPPQDGSQQAKFQALTATPPGFPRGFNNPASNPTVGVVQRLSVPNVQSAQVPQNTVDPRMLSNASAPPQNGNRGTISNGQSTPLAPPTGFNPDLFINSMVGSPLPGSARNQAFPVPNINSPQIPQGTLDPSRITLGLPQKEIDRNPLPCSYSSQQAAKNAVSRPQQASRQWSDLPSPARSQAPPGTISTAELQRFAAQKQAYITAQGIPLGPVPTTEYLQQLAERKQFQAGLPNVGPRTRDVAHDVSSEEFLDREKRAKEYQAHIAQVPVHAMSAIEEGRLVSETMSMRSGQKNTYPEQQVELMLRNVHVIPNSGPRGVGLRLENAQYANGFSSPSLRSLLQRRTLKQERLNGLIADVQGRAQELTIKERQTRELRALTGHPAVQTASTQGKENENIPQLAVDKEVWGAFLDEPWLSEELTVEPQQISRPLTPRPGGALSPAIMYRDGDAEEIRRTKLLAQTLTEFHSAWLKSNERKAVQVERPSRAIPVQELALNRIPPAKTGRRFSIDAHAPIFGKWQNREAIDQMDNKGCTFCLFECDFGISDPRVWLPNQASYGYCTECHFASNVAKGVDIIPVRDSQPDHLDAFDWEQFWGKKGSDNQLIDLTTSEGKTKVAPMPVPPPLKEFGEKEGFRKQAMSFSGDPTRVQSLSVLHPKCIFDAAMEAGGSRPGATQVTGQVGRAQKVSKQMLPIGATNATYLGHQFDTNQGPRMRSNEISIPGPVMASGGILISMNQGSRNRSNAVSDQGSVTTTGKQMFPFAANRPPRPSPLATVTDMSPVKGPPAVSGVESSFTNEKPPSPPLPVINRAASNTSFGAARGNRNPGLTLAPLTGEKFGCIFNPEDPESPALSDVSVSSDSYRRNRPRRSLSDTIKPRGLPAHLNQTFSAIDGMNITEHTVIMFCRGCPWRQVDVLKAKICDQCRYEKFLIVRHNRHMQWKLVANEEPMRDENGEASETLRRDRSCMVCPGQAMFLCADCPLRLCDVCHTFLTMQCKGWLDNLFYHYGRTHIRNDAFLLRSDGHGH